MTDLTPTQATAVWYGMRSWTVMLFGRLLPPLAQTRQVVAVELQYHGHTADIDRVLIYELMAADIVALISYLGLEQYDLFGYSLGGVALQNAIRHPHVVRRLVVVSSSYKSDGWYPEVLAAMASRNAK